MAAKVLTRMGLLLALGLIGLAIWLWVFGGAAEVQRWAASAQHEAQSAMARGLRALKSGEPGAWWGLMSICFAYGFFHAAGPGHGKLVLGGYGLGRAVTLWKLSALAVASSLAQAGTAVGLVLAGVLAFDWGREQMTEMAERMFAPLSYGLMALLGLYLLVRGLRRGWRQSRAQAEPHDSHHHHHHHDEVCASCGHRHGLTLEEAANLTSLREALAIVFAIAARPCTGAIFLLLLTWRLDLLSAGIAGAFAMGLGTAVVTLVVALLAAGLRGGLLVRGLISAGAVGRIAALLEVSAGAIVLLLCTQLLLRAL
ncbi:nickel/cobalt transporter [Arenibacterium sp. LLYu02]|uniref:nickel/cobalt transporter n=1 Tax=Arenibacterium sp. LLYu02 TaxID=3404132 RepID=UPI003B2154EC